MKKLFLLALMAAVAVAAFAGGSKDKELTLEEIEAQGTQGLEEILATTTSKPWRGEAFIPGKLGGTWHSVVQADPKSFNLLIAERDSATAGIVGAMHDYLMDYDPVARAWKPRLASFELQADEAADTLTVIFTLRDDLYWSYYNNAQPRVPVTSDDVVFWYNEISGDPECQSSALYQQYLTMKDGSDGHVDIEKISDKKFALHFPRIVADPLLACNMDFGPAHIYQKAKQERGVEGVFDLFSVNTDPKTIPSMGELFLVEYSPGQRLVYKRNPDYWRKDSTEVSIPYPEEQIVRIIPDENTQRLIFLEGETEIYSLKPEDLSDMAGKSGVDYTVFNVEGSLSAAYWTFNQNPIHRNSPKYRWFTQKEFRQAMSSLLNRDRIISQVYRGLAAPMYYFFPEPNTYYNPAITLKYRYDTAQALRLLESIGIKRDNRGVMRDANNNAIEFDLTIRSESSINTDIASIIMDELSKVGIKVNIRTLDFQKQVEQLTETYEWDSMIMGLSGSNIFPSQGSNVWPSSGNLHLWYPNQESPATTWEARIDYLHNEGSYTIDTEKAKKIWDEYQEIILEQCPVISLLRTRGFYAMRNRWDFTNVYFDNVNGAETSFAFLK
jgi:peptide/nickel transport system substrate-binding protein